MHFPVFPRGELSAVGAVTGCGCLVLSHRLLSWTAGAGWPGALCWAPVAVSW